MRPTKKQKNILDFIEQFIVEHGYSPSYREIMTGLNYSSIATVSLHINSLISRGFLTKRDHSARSLELVKDGTFVIKPLIVEDTKWLKNKINKVFDFSKDLSNEDNQKIEVVIYALKILELEELANYLTNKIKK